MNGSKISVAGIQPSRPPLDAVAALAERAANQRGASLLDAGLRLFADGRADAVSRGAVDPDSAESVSPYDLGRAYELLLAPESRRRKGAHLTPAQIARNLVAMMPEPASSGRILDPAVGGAAFLLASAEQLALLGVAPAAVLDQLFGIDIDPGAVAVAEAALVLWGLEHGLDAGPLDQIAVGDGLLDDLPAVERVVGNPPFLNQLRKSSSHSAERRHALRERWGDLIGTYTDDAWVFLAAGLDALTQDGVLAMVQPVSVLAARHGQAVRNLVMQHGSLNGLWVAREQVFDASVQVCGVVIGCGANRKAAVERTVGADFTSLSPLPSQPEANGWGSVAAAAIDVPAVARLTTSNQTIGNLATATAGFRDQFYGFVPFVSDSPSSQVPADHAPLVTVGMVDVLQNRWGSAAFKFAKQSYERPVIDLAALRRDDPTLASWVAARLRPKLLLATQTRVVEVWVDTQGRSVPATPVVSIEPHDQDPEVLWQLAAALSAPVISAHLLAAKFGTALSLNAMKLAARDVLAVPLPADRQAWVAGAELLQAESVNLVEFATVMGRAYGWTGQDIVDWWLPRTGVTYA